MHTQLNILTNSPPCEQTESIPLYCGDIEDDLTEFTSVKQALQIVGGLSNPSKMPCYAYNLPASRCRTGSRLRHVKGSVCHGCYAADDIDWLRQKCEGGKFRMNRYVMDTTRNALERRYQSLSDPRWVPAMVYLLRHYSIAKGKRKAVKYFRWHDSGDLAQDANHLANILKVAEFTPAVKHWLPTREYSTVKDCNPPPNMTIRLSAHMVNGSPPNGFGLPTSTVSTGSTPENGGSRCFAYKRGGECGGCRKCWDSNIQNIDYKVH